jgi:phage shock protein A
MNREQLEQRIANYKNSLVTAQEMVKTLQANINATQGAIQECEYWLSQLPPVETTPEVPEQSGEKQ